MDCELKRKEGSLTVMNTVTEALVDQATCQEVSALLLENELNGLKALESTLQKISKGDAAEREAGEKAESHAKAVSDSRSKMAKTTLQPEDKATLTLHKMLTNSDVDPCMLTYDDVIGLLSDF